MYINSGNACIQKKKILLVIAARFNDLLVNDPLARLLALVIVGCNIFIHFKVICYNALDGTRGGGYA